MTVCDQCGQLAMNTITICEECRHQRELDEQDRANEQKAWDERMDALLNNGESEP